ncbi:hypothetical protein HVTV-2_gp125 [Haloarcula virus HVTV-2]|uniref:Uncharacterized protein n=1 Tax=Haloarcula vallismortis tailed virus 1 TaxID=1262528 RepID=L7TJD2_9CAUD|nr:hypothetical protein HVTV1_124 [Haloarcula vallismortis tailed virus 1]AGC34493.1 hypothetical protein HVTV1_124 [Haloarcula vallismortis tailed virus 1]UBF22932.1 hypothetical protein HVTV-2_gp125 [Haloarcula virus HVTV-2]
MPLVDVILSHLVSEVGVVGLFIIWVLYQVYSPEWMPNTKFQQVASDIESEVRETKHLLVSTITVLRAVVRTNDEVDTDKVDEYLVENGVEPDDFIRDAHLPNHDRNPGDD